MDLARISARQKRYRDWEEYLSEPSNVQTDELRSRITNTLQEYRSVLTSCWENSSVNEADEHKLQDLERELDRMHEEARLTVKAKRKQCA